MSQQTHRVDRQSIEDAARCLRTASETREPCGPVRNLLPYASIDDAYSVQEINTQHALDAGHRQTGWKIGLTSLSVQQQLGVNQPDFGTLLADWWVPDGEGISVDRLLQPKVEAEVAFVLEKDLPDSAVTTADILDATGFVLPAIEIADSRIADWDITIIDTIADNASSGMYVLGNNPTKLDTTDLREIRMTLAADGQEVSSGKGEACLGDPINAAVWLANAMAGVGRPLRAGHVVLSGALGPMVPAVTGTTYEATFDRLGTIRVTFEQEA